MRQSLHCERLGTMDTEMIREFFYAVSYGAVMNLHLKILDAEQQPPYGGSFVQELRKGAGYGDRGWSLVSKRRGQQKASL